MPLSCLVGEAIAGKVQQFRNRNHRYPKSLRLEGAQWDRGTWKLSYATRKACGRRFQHATATQRTKRVTADFGR